MTPDDASSLPAVQPDLEEFLSALDGFLSKQTSPADPSNLRFLEIFFRSVKSDKGHLLKISELGALQSVVSFGIGKSFDEEFNRAHELNSQEPSPLDMVFRDKDALAILDVTKDPDVPKWFMDLMIKYKFVSLVAVPLMGTQNPVGILCAYYHDMCLFDRATLGHLMMIGKMVGQATEKSLVADRAESHGEKDKAVDHFLKILLGKPFTKIQVYSLLAKIVSESLNLSGLVCGPVSKISRGLTLTVVDGSEIQANVLSNQFLLPPFVNAQFRSGNEKPSNLIRSQNDWGELKEIIKGNLSMDLCRPLIWQNQVEGAILGWRLGNQHFDDSDNLLLSRLAGIASLAMHSV